MTYQLPRHIPISDLAMQPVVHLWNDYDPYILFREPSEYTENMLLRISNCAKIAFAIGCAEWVVSRFSAISDDLLPQQFIEACWAAEMSSSFATPDETEDEEWQGPVRGPIDLALMTILNTFYAVEDGNAEEDAAFAELVALHVLPYPDEFLVWREQVLIRFAALYPAKEKSRSGAVPREALNTKIDFKYSQNKLFIEQFLKDLDSEKNPLLISFPTN